MNHEYICIEITGDCNNACRHCYNFWRGASSDRGIKNEENLSREEIHNLVIKIKEDIPLQYVAITGGEPTLRPDFPEIVGDLVDLGITPAVITNGVLLTEDLLKKLPSDVVFQITLLGHTAELHNRLAGRDVFDKVIHNISRIEKHGSRFVAAFVATKLNALDVYLVIELSLALGANAFMFNRFNLSASVKDFVDEIVPSAEILRQSLELVEKAVSDYGIDVVCSVPIPPCVVDIRMFPSIKFGWCPRGGSHAYYTVGTTGLLRPCNHSSLVLGDLRTQSFAELISSDACKSFWQPIPSECINCTHPLKDECQGGCTAASSEFYGSQNYIDPICTFARGAFSSSEKN